MLAVMSRSRSSSMASRSVSSAPRSFARATSNSESRCCPAIASAALASAGKLSNDSLNMTSAPMPMPLAIVLT